MNSTTKANMQKKKTGRIKFCADTYGRDSLFHAIFCGELHILFVVMGHSITTWTRRGGMGGSVESPQGSRHKV